MPLTNKETIIKSKTRVRDQGEVYTPAKMVNEMVDMLGDAAYDFNKTVLEPSCGNGNFIVEILRRRLSKISKRKNIIEREYLVLVTLSKIYGIDILQDNIIEARSRLEGLVAEYFAHTRNSAKFLTAASTIIDKNIVIGDALKHKSAITLLEWTPLYEQKGFEINPHTLAKIENDMKDVVVASTAEEIQEKVDSIFTPKLAPKKDAKRRSKDLGHQASLFSE